MGQRGIREYCCIVVDLQGETEIPVPQAGELLVKESAVSLSFRDRAFIDGIYEPHMVPKLLIPLNCSLRFANFNRSSCAIPWVKSALDA